MMTKEEKRMKRYTSAIERRLNLPLEIKARVMSDFISSITARREAGMTDEQIYAELGDPKKVAAELNEQMKEYTYRKSPWRFIFLLAAVYGAVELLGNLVSRLLYCLVQAQVTFTPHHSIGVIGGADGPTAIFVTTPDWTYIVLPALMLAVGIWGFLRLRKCRQK